MDGDTNVPVFCAYENMNFMDEYFFHKKSLK